MGTAVRSEPVSADDIPYDDAGEQYYYGYRMTVTHNAEGVPFYSCRSLTLDDFLEPEEGDVYMQGNLHEDDVIRLRTVFRFHLRDRGNMTVYSDLKMIWGVRGLQNPAPDISVIPDVTDPERPRGSFSVQEEGVRPLFVLEVVSPRYRDADILRKPDIYRKAGVAEYVIVDPGLRKNRISYTVGGYRMSGSRYVKIEPDAQGRIRSLTTGVLIGVNETGDRLFVLDAATGEEIPSDEERAEQEKTRADSAEEELRRLRARLEAMGISTD